MSKKYRPFCDYCGLVCGVIWFIQKQENIIQETKLEEQKDQGALKEAPVTREKKLELEPKKPIVLCIKCQTEGNYPTILSEEDFVKVDLLS